MSLEPTPTHHRPQPVRKDLNIHSKFLVVANGMSPELAADILNGLYFTAQLTHGYRPEILGLGRFTRTTSRSGKVSYERRYPREEVIDNVPQGISAGYEYKQATGKSTHYRGYKDTKGRRIGKTRHVVPVRLRPELGKFVQVDVFRGGIRKGAPGLNELAGRMICIVHFTTLEEAKEFNSDNFSRPPWLGDEVTKLFSTKKLVRQLRGEMEQDLAPDLLQRSASIEDLRKRAA